MNAEEHLETGMTRVPPGEDVPMNNMNSIHHARWTCGARLALGAALLYATASLGAGSTPAQPSTPEDTPPGHEEGGTVESKITCYDLSVDNTGLNRGVQIKNKCGETKRVRPVINWWWPSDTCLELKDGQTRAYYFKAPATFSHLAACFK
jgi:hypothetical protein